MTEQKNPGKKSTLLRSRSFWLLVVLLVTLAAVTRYSVREKPSILLEGVDEIAPDVAEILYEMDDVAQQLASDFPQSPGAIFVIGQIHKDFGKLEAAIDYWEQCIELDPLFPGAYGSIGMSRLEMGQHEEAEKHLAMAVRLSPDSSRLAVAWAQSLLAQGRTEEALGILRADVQKHPRAMASIALLGHTYVQLRQFEKGKETLQMAIVLGPEYTNAYHGLVAACTNLGQQEEAIQYAETLRALKAKDEQAHRDSLKGEVDVLRIKVSSAKLYVEVANEYLAIGDAKLAETHLHRSLELDSESSLAYEVLTWLYLRQGRKQEAKQMVDEMLAIGKDDLRVQMRAGGFLTELGDFSEAEKTYRKSIELTPELAGGYASLANLLLRQKTRISEAQTLAKKAAELEPTVQYLLLHANASIAAKDTLAARLAIERAKALEPNNEEVQRALQMLKSMN